MLTPSEAKRKSIGFKNSKTKEFFRFPINHFNRHFGDAHTQEKHNAYGYCSFHKTSKIIIE